MFSWVKQPVIRRDFGIDFMIIKRLFNPRVTHGMGKKFLQEFLLLFDGLIKFNEM